MRPAASPSRRVYARRARCHGRRVRRFHSHRLLAGRACLLGRHVLPDGTGLLPAPLSQTLPGPTVHAAVQQLAGHSVPGGEGQEVAHVHV